MAVRGGRGPAGRGARLRRGTQRAGPRKGPLFLSVPVLVEGQTASDRQLQLQARGIRTEETSWYSREHAHLSRLTSRRRLQARARSVPRSMGARRGKGGRTHSAAASRQRPPPPSAPSCACKRSGSPSKCKGRPARQDSSRLQSAHAMQSTRDVRVVLRARTRRTWCSDPWQRWHWVHSLANAVSALAASVTCRRCSSAVRGRQLWHTAWSARSEVGVSQR